MLSDIDSALCRIELGGYGRRVDQKLSRRGR
jgi:hypothetical protein